VGRPCQLRASAWGKRRCRPSVGLGWCEKNNRTAKKERKPATRQPTTRVLLRLLRLRRAWLLFQRGQAHRNPTERDMERHHVWLLARRPPLVTVGITGWACEVKKLALDPNPTRTKCMGAGKVSSPDPATRTMKDTVSVNTVQCRRGLDSAALWKTRTQPKSDTNKMYGREKSVRPRPSSRAIRAPHMRLPQHGARNAWIRLLSIKNSYPTQIQHSFPVCTRAMQCY
jgi:hypothetical protein